MIKKEPDRFFTFSQTRQDSAGDEIGDLIELSVGELPARAYDGNAVW